MLGRVRSRGSPASPTYEPTAPELTLDTETETVEQSAERLIEYVEERLAGARPAAATSA